MRGLDLGGHLWIGQERLLVGDCCYDGCGDCIYKCGCDFEVQGT